MINRCRFLFNVSVFLVLLTKAALAEAKVICLADEYAKVQTGEWILMESNPGGQSLTLIVEKNLEDVLMDIKIIEDNKTISVSRQLFNLTKNKFTEIRIKQDGRVHIVLSPENDIEKLLNLPLKFMQKEEIKVKKGKILCDKYRGIYQDYVVDIWINKEIPVMGLAKIVTKGFKTEILDWGEGSLDPFYNKS